ncbi:MAG: Flp pilus assembly complex ATPase component TadA [Nitrospirae bacterium]|nr:Flp pilus assembly complex ATPase component TadA [Nitrospirota bacterium]
MATIRIGDLLKSRGLISDKQLGIALIQQRVTGDLLGDAIIKLGFVSSKEMAYILAEQSSIPFVDLTEYQIPEAALRAVPKEVAAKSRFIPLDYVDGKLTIGIINSSNIMAVDAAARITKTNPSVCIVDSDGFDDYLETAYFFLENPIQKQFDENVKSITTTGTVTGPIITALTDLMIMDGIRRSTTDIHITPLNDIVHIFYRVDGVLQYGHGVPKVAQSGIISRIKILSQLDIAEQRLPQDGAMTFTFLNRKYDIRVSTIPTIYGENTVLRILPVSLSLANLDRLGFDEANIKNIKKLFKKPFGIILVTGPTGSGKTTTLYAALREINILERNVLTVEDPVEYKLAFVKQTQVNEKAGFDFALAGRNFMRQDPDVILLGEIRDEETAKIAIRASITGHLVISTLHANDATTAVPRLLDLGIDRFLLSTSILAVVSQRLIRKLCQSCKTAYELDNEESAVFKEYGFSLTNAFKEKGCPKCSGSGFAGRTVIGEIMVIDDEIKELIFSGASVTKITEAAIRKGMKVFKSEGLRKASLGITSLEEVLRVTG